MEPSLGASCSTDKDEWDKCFSNICNEIPVDKWKPLGIQLGFTSTKLGQIKYDTDREGIKETINCMLEKWRQGHGSAATEQKLAAALQQVGLTDVAQKFFPQFPCCSQSAGMSGLDTMGLDEEEEKYTTEIQDVLRGRYRKLKLPGVPWVNLILPLEQDLYVDLIITERDKYRSENRTEHIQLEKIFLPMKAQSQTHKIVVDEKRYLVVGGPGFGKTSTLKKIAYDWAEGKEYTSQYQLVLFLELRHINNNLEELIKEEAELSKQTIALFPLLDKMGKTVLLLLDGFDELRQTQIKDLHDLLRRNLFPNMTVIISSRTIPITNEDDAIFWNRLIEIKGFTEEKAKEFLAKYLQQENPELLWEKLDTVLAHKKAQVLSCPLFLLLIGRMVEQEQLKHITSRTELFKAALNFMVRRSLAKTQKIKSEEPFDMFSDQTSSSVTSPFWNSSKLFSVLLKFGEFSWECLKTKTLCFERSHVLQHCEDKVVFEMGILMESDKQSETIEAKQFYEPVHKTFMEFAAALYLAQKMQENEEFHDELKKQLKDLPGDEKVNLLSCLFFLDEIMESKFSILSLLKDTVFFNFYNDLLSYATAVDEAEAIELCREFANNMKPVAHIKECNKQFGLSILKLKQIKMLYCSSTDELPIECVDVETLIIRMANDDKIKTSLPKMNCERIIFQFHCSYKDVGESLKPFSEIMNHLVNQSRSEKPFPEIQLIIIYGRFFHELIEDLPSLKTVKIHSIQLINSDHTLSLPQLTRLVNTFDISSELIIQFTDVGDVLIQIALLKELAAKLSCKTRFFIKSFPFGDFSVLESEDNKGLVEQLNISAEEIDQFDLSSYPRLTSLLITMLSEPVDLLSLFELIKEKAPRINHILIYVPTTSNVRGVVLSLPKQQEDFNDTECPSRDSPTVVEQVTLHMDPSRHKWFEQLQKILSNKQILRLNVHEPTTTKYELQRYFPSSGFEIDCVYLPLYDRWTSLNWSNLYYVIQNKSPS